MPSGTDDEREEEESAEPHTVTVSYESPGLATLMINDPLKVLLRASDSDPDQDRRYHRDHGQRPARLMLRDQWVTTCSSSARSSVQPEERRYTVHASLWCGMVLPDRAGHVRSSAEDLAQGGIDADQEGVYTSNDSILISLKTVR
jgi:hypothetical protein